MIATIAMIAMVTARHWYTGSTWVLPVEDPAVICDTCTRVFNRCKCRLNEY